MSPAYITFTRTNYPAADIARLRHCSRPWSTQGGSGEQMWAREKMFERLTGVVEKADTCTMRTFAESAKWPVAFALKELTAARRQGSASS